MTLLDLEEIARRARESLSRMEHQSSAVRELGGKMPEEFWHAFSDAVVSVRLAERDVQLERERLEKAR